MDSFYIIFTYSVRLAMLFSAKTYLRIINESKWQDLRGYRMKFMWEKIDERWYQINCRALILSVQESRNTLRTK